MNIKMIIQMVGIGCLLSCNKLEQIDNLEFPDEDGSNQLNMIDHKEENLEDLDRSDQVSQRLYDNPYATAEDKSLALETIIKNQERRDEINDKINNLQEAKTKLEE